MSFVVTSTSLRAFLTYMVVHHSSFTPHDSSVTTLTCVKELLQSFHLCPSEFGVSYHYLARTYACEAHLLLSHPEAALTCVRELEQTKGKLMEKNQGANLCPRSPHDGPSLSSIRLAFMGQVHAYNEKRAKATLYNNMAVVRMMQGDDLAALALLERAVAMDSGSLDSQRNLILLYLHTGLQEKALRFLRTRRTRRAVPTPMAKHGQWRRGRR